MSSRLPGNKHTGSQRLDSESLCGIRHTTGKYYGFSYILVARITVVDQQGSKMFNLQPHDGCKCRSWPLRLIAEVEVSLLYPSLCSMSQ